MHNRFLDISLSIWNPYNNKKCDVWSIGIIIYELIFKCLPFEVDDHFKIKKTLSFPENNNLDPNFIDLLRRMLEFDQEKRPNFQEIRGHKVLQGIIQEKLDIRK